MLIVQCDFDETITIGYVSTAIREAFAPDIRGTLEGKASVISIQKAGALIGYDPQYSWQTETC